MREANKKRHILKLYTNDTKITYEQLSVITDSSVYYIKSVLKNFHTDSVAYYDYCIAPSCLDENVYFLFSSNGSEKKLKKVSDYIYPQEELTQLEELYVSINLGKNIFYENN